MAGALAKDPPWRGWFLRQLPRAEGGAPIAHALFTMLATTGHPAKNAEIGPYLDVLIRNGDFMLAFVTWLGFLPAEQAKSVAFAYNGDFEQPISGLPFDWELSHVRGAVTEVVAGPNHASGKALRVVFSGTRVAYRHAAKLMVLQPGTYELSGTVSADTLTTARGMRWRVACAEGDGEQLAETDAYAGTFPARGFAVTFTVPPRGCRAQRLRLELDQRVALEQQAVGTFWSDNLALRRVDVMPLAAGGGGQ